MISSNGLPAKLPSWLPTTRSQRSRPAKSKPLYDSSSLVNLQRYCTLHNSRWLPARCFWGYQGRHQILELLKINLVIAWCVGVWIEYGCQDLYSSICNVLPVLASHSLLCTYAVMEVQNYLPTLSCFPRRLDIKHKRLWSGSFSRLPWTSCIFPARYAIYRTSSLKKVVLDCLVI